MDRKLQEVLEKGITEIDPALADLKIISRLVRLYDEIELFNPKYALVNAGGEELVVRHILDCLAPVGIFRQFSKPSVRISDWWASTTCRMPTRAFAKV